MNIEAIVKKHTNKTGWAFAHDSCQKSMRAALTELAAEYEQERKNTAHQIDACMRDNVSLRQRIRQLEAERVPEGWQTMPKVLTQEMLFAVQGTIPVTFRNWQLAYNRLLAAAPQQKKEGE